MCETVVTVAVCFRKDFVCSENIVLLSQNWAALTQHRIY